MTREAGRRSPLSAAVSIAAWFAYLFLVLPSLIVIPMSFGDKDEFVFPPRSLSLYLYKRYLFEGNWMSAPLESGEVALGATALSLALGIAAAYALVRFEFPGKRLATLFLLSPIFVPVIVVALGLYLYLGYAGIAGSTFGTILSHTVVTLP